MANEEKGEPKRSAAAEAKEERAESGKPDYHAIARKLVSAQLTKKEVKKENAPMVATATSKAPRYPWGLSLNLDEPTLAKLKMRSLPVVGGELHLVACCRVTSASENHSEGDAKPRRSVSLQITDLAMQSGRRTAKRRV